MKKGELISGQVTEVRFPNKGIVQTQDGECVVKNAITGQVVEARVTKKRRGKAEGNLVRVITKSPLEHEPPCPGFGTCGGCTYLSLPYEEQCALKEGQVRSLLADAVRGSSEEAMRGTSADPLPWFEGIIASPVQLGYRNKMEFTFGDSYRDGPLALGMHKRGSFYDIVDADHCVIVDEDYRKILRATRDFFAERKTPYFHRRTHAGYLRHLLVRKAAGTGEILLDLVTTTQLPAEHAERSAAARVVKPSMETVLEQQEETIVETAGQIEEEQMLREYTQLLLSLPLQGSFAGILHTKNDSVADVIKDEGTQVLFGRPYFMEEMLGLAFKVTPFSFFQTNSHGAAVLYETARRYIADVEAHHGTVYDLYCGTGTITQLMAPVSGKVIGVEIVPEAVEAAKENAQRNGISNCEFLCGDVLKVLDGIEEKPDMIILDPPRDGIHPKALPKILSYGVKYILYISCKPTSLARDLPAFMEAGYKPARGVCVDQFPWTTGIETVVLLSRKKV